MDVANYKTMLKLLAAIAAAALLGVPAMAQVDPKIHKLCIEAKDYAGCVRAMTSAPQPEGDALTPLRNAMKQVAGRLSFGTSLADSTSTFQPVVDQLSIVESNEPNSLAVKTAQEAVQLFDILQTAWRVRIQSENTAFRGVSGDLRVYNCKNLKTTADAFDAVSTTGRVYWSYSKSPLFGDTCKINYGQEPDALMYPIIVRLLREGAISNDQIKAREVAEQDRKDKLKHEKELCAMGPWNRRLEEDPKLKAWAKANPSAAKEAMTRFIAKEGSKSNCSNVELNYSNYFAN